MPTVSIVVPVYGAETFLPRCLDSVLAQTFTDWECILVEDGSPDQSGAICDSYAQKDPRFRVVHQPNQGGSAARNNGVKLAQGTYLVFLDNDDAMDPYLLESAVCAQHTHPDGLIFWGYSTQPVAVYKSPAHFQDFPQSQAAELYISSHLLFAWNKLYLLSFVRQIGLEHGSTVYGTDTIFAMEYTCNWFVQYPQGRFYRSDRQLYYYEAQNTASESAHYGKSYCKDELLLTKHAIEWFTHSFDSDPESKKQLWASLLRTLGGAVYLECRDNGFPAASAAVTSSSAQQLAALAKQARCRTPLVRAFLKGQVRRCVYIGQLIVDKSPLAYLRLCRLYELLRL